MCVYGKLMTRHIRAYSGRLAATFSLYQTTHSLAWGALGKEDGETSLPRRGRIRRTPRSSPCRLDALAFTAATSSVLSIQE